MLLFLHIFCILHNGINCITEENKTAADRIQIDTPS